MNRSVFARILTACLVPLILIFSLVIASINRIVYEQNIQYANDKLRAFVDETTLQVNDRLINTKGVLEILSCNLAALDSSNPNAIRTAENLARTTLHTVPDACSVWFSIVSGEFLPDEQFSRNYVRTEENMVELDDLSEEILGDSSLASWYHVPFTTDSLYFESPRYYDYGLGNGGQYTGTVSAPLNQNGRTIGVAGIDFLYSEMFDFINEKQAEDEQKILILNQNGDIIYSVEEEFIEASICDLLIENKEEVTDYLSQKETFWVEGESPFFDADAKMFFNPIFTEFSNEQLYLFVAFPTDTFLRGAQEVTRTIIATSILGLSLLTLILFFTTRSIVKPIMKLTESANMIADGNLDVNLDSELVNISDGKKQSKNEIQVMFVALNKMLYQLNQMQQLRLENMQEKHEREKAEMSDRSKSEFLAKMSHEIRTPMNAIVGMAELALRGDIPPATHEHIVTIKQASGNLLSLINDILDFSKIESGKLQIIPTDYLFSSLMNDVISIIRMRAVDRHMDFMVNIDCDIPNALIGDEIRVRQVLLNLLSNAIKYTDKGYVSVSAYGDIIDENTVILTIEITDTGKGIKKEDMEKLFGDFVQIDLENNRGVKGTGLGLAISKNLMLAMGGDITVFSEYGKGSTFVVSLPQKFSRYEKVAAVEDPTEKNVLIYEQREIYANSIVCTLDNLGVNVTLVSTDSEFYEKLSANTYFAVFLSTPLFQDAKKVIEKLGAKLKVVLLTEFAEVVSEPNVCVLSMPVHAISIANVLNGVSDSFSYNEGEEEMVRFTAPTARVLIVDDINTNLKVAEGLMLSYKMQIDLCNTGVDAIEATKSNHYDIIFMDHMMPDMDGVEATLKIRSLGDKDAYFKNVPIVALTANAISGMKEMFLQNGFDDFLAKPIEIVKLNAILERWIPKEKKEKFTDKKPEPSVFGFEIAGVDVNAGIDNTGGNAVNYIRTLAIFYEDVLQKIDELELCLATDNMPLYATHVHALKSASASIGAKQVSETASELEMAGKREDLVYVNKHNGQFIKDLELLLENIRKAVSAGQKEKAVDNVNYKILKEELVKLRSALDSLDVTEIDDAVHQLQEFSSDAKIGHIIKEILEDTLIGEYEGAIDLISQFLEGGISETS